ncbi:hypothetical protein CkaCkLH20_12348 [Colletotrichum karsti]|uniref:Asl1-like glycosyl hydrolase catalytic domain-containing protein n=1 Tax=Colletotrichum karsti TaxID=1095194 RepID=A0A9P6HTW0_9PEZI|nr:uncharacterized protein CkaCkLH20_12348 [Colletotrichum karsti]KAF9870114.1 hypothetical protein CkaCkLH20_12348 [Colletotrichum karsti]
MYAKNVVLAAAGLALVEQALGFNAHRHAHQQAKEKRGDDWVIATIDGQVVSWINNWHGPTPAAPVAAQSTTTVPVVVPTPAPVVAAAAPTTTLVTSYAPKVQALAASPSSSKAAAATGAVSAKGAYSGSKRGLAYNDASLVSSFMSSAGEKCGWAYNWDSSSNGLSANLNYVPMLWGPIPTHLERWTKNANAAIEAGSTHILSFNECDLPAQCNMGASAAAAAHIEHMNPYSGKAKIGAPAITNSNIAGQGLDWLSDWVKACKEADPEDTEKQCKYDFCVTHWYSPADAADTLFSHLEKVNKICDGKPVWLTEFAPLGSDDQISSFVQANVPKLDAVSYLDRYAYFMVKDGVLMSGNSVNALGSAYASA